MNRTLLQLLSVALTACPCMEPACASAGGVRVLVPADMAALVCGQPEWPAAATR